MPLDLVAEVSLRRGRRLARSKAKRRTHAVDAVPGHHGFLQHDLALGALKHPAANRRVLALGVLAHHQEVNVAGLAAHQVVSRRWWKLGGAGTETAWWSGSGREVKVGG
jgi:hypothetical protein